MIGFDRDLDHVAVFALAVFFDVHAGQELQTIQLMEALDAARGGGLGAVVVRVDVAGAVERCADETPPHLPPGWPLGRGQSDVRPQFALRVLTTGDHKLGRKKDRAGIERLGGVTTRPALARVVKPARFHGHAHGRNDALRDQIKARLLGIGILKIKIVGRHGDYSWDSVGVVVVALAGVMDVPAHLAISAPRCGGSSRSRRPLRSLAGKPWGLTVCVTKAR